MTEAHRAVAGFIPECFPALERTRQTSASRRDTWVTAGALPGRTIAGSFTTGRRRVLMATRGVSARSWCGGMLRRSNGQGWIRLISRRLLRLTPRKTFIVDTEWRRWGAQSRLFCILMAWDGCTWQAG